ncbi:MAG: tetratricopeptide repeat protein [Ardenticatenaceae bacterium]|nr:tetratricopeptide repeat protein [Ardenticatenaceae bacterium]
MDFLTILAIIGGIVGIIAGLVQVIDYLQNRRQKVNEANKKIINLIPKMEQDSANLAHLRYQFSVLFNDSELQTLSFDLGIDYESLSGNGKVDKARELVAFMNRNGRLPDLIAAGKSLRPHAKWDEETPVPHLSPPEILHNLPRRQKFVGREAEKAAVLEALKAKDYLISIEGFGGIGKSTLALEVAYICLEASLASEFDEDGIAFDGFVWASAKAQELTLNNLVDTIARTLNYRGIAQLPLENKQLELRQLLQSKSYLIIVDNFETIHDEGVRTFLHDLPEPSQCLVTTREQRLRNAHVIALQKLRQDDALTLMREEGRRLGLKALARASEQTLLPLYNATGGAPLAIKWATGQIKQKGQSLETVIGALQNAEGAIFETIFSRSWNLLSDNARAILTTLPLFTTPADQADIEAASNVNNSQLVEGIGQLVEMSLVNAIDELDLIHRRYDIHPLCRSFARAQLAKSPSLEQEARLRLAKYYLERSCQERGTWGDVSGFPWFEAELPNILASLEWASKEKELSLATKMFYCIYFFLGTRGYWEERLTYGQMALKVAELANDIKATAEVQYSIGWILYRQDKHQEADEILQKSFDLYFSIGDTEQAALIQATRARIAISQNKLDEAQSIIDEIVRTFGEDDAVLLSAKGKLALRENEYEKAEELLLKALNILKREGKEISFGSRQIDLGNVALAQRDYAKAAAYFEAALESSKKVYRQENIAHAEFGMARVYAKQGRLADARHMAMSAQDQFERMLMRYEINQADELLHNLNVNGKIGRN